MGSEDLGEDGWIQCEKAKRIRSIDDVSTCRSKGTGGTHAEKALFFMIRPNLRKCTRELRVMMLSESCRIFQILGGHVLRMI